MKTKEMKKADRKDLDQKLINELDFLTMPIVKVESKKDAIIVMTGVYEQMAGWNISAMHTAKKLVEEKGFNVVSGVISISNTAKPNPSVLTDSIYKELVNEPWIIVDKLEGELLSTPIYCYTLADRIKKYFDYHNQSNVQLFYVHSSNEMYKTGSFINAGIGMNAICVLKPDEHYNMFLADFNTKKSDYKGWNNILFTDNLCDGYELSTKVKSYGYVAPFGKNIYLVRQDGVPLEFVNKFVEILKENSVEKNVEFRIFNSDDITTDVTGCISMDRYVKDKYTIDLSRLFNISDSQSRALDMTSTGLPIDVQFDAIPAGEYKLIDDDSATGFGFTMNYVVQNLKSRGVIITSTDTLVRTLVAEDEVIYDVVDAIDFYAGADGGGLVVKYPSEIKRVPYIFPYVNLVKRANIAPELQKTFTKSIIELNMGWEFTEDEKSTDKFKDDIKLFLKTLEVINNNLGV